MTTPPFLKICFVTAGLLALTPSGHAQPPHKARAHKAAPAKAASDSPHSWQPDSALVKQLGEEVDLLGYHIRSPKGYVLEQKPFQSNTDTGTTYIWKGELRTDETRPSFVIYVRNIAPGFHPLSSEKILDAFQTETGGKMQGFTQSPVQDGEINGVSFVRAYWKGASPTSMHLHGFTYVAVDEHTIITLIAADSEPYSKSTLPLMEATAETFHRD